VAKEIDHPRYYNMGGEIGSDGSAEFEAIKIIEDLGWGFEFCMGNAVKYALRAPHKGDELGDLLKARWYLNRACRYGGRIRARIFRKIDIEKAIAAWALVDVYERLAETVRLTAVGDPFGALNDLNIYMVKFGAPKDLE